MAPSRASHQNPEQSELSDELSSVEHDSSPRSSKRRRISSDSETANESNRPPTPPPTSFYAAPSRVRKTVSTPASNHIASIVSQIPPSILTSVSSKPKTSGHFSDLPLAPWLLTTLNTLSITNPTPIQLSTITPILSGSDVLASAPTGTGKTLAFALPVLHAWSQDPFGTYALVLTPTRELALQIYEQFSALGASQDLKVALITGGSEMRPQALALGRRPHIVVATPGRLADHILQSGPETVAGFKRVKVLVLDEADRLLDKSARMLSDLEVCLSALPERGRRQTLLYTATMTDEVRALRDMNQSENGGQAQTKRDVFVAELSQTAGEGDLITAADREDGIHMSSTADSSARSRVMIPKSLRQSYLTTPSPQKAAYLHVLLSHLLTSANTTKTPPQIIVFTNRTTTCSVVHATLINPSLSHTAVALHSRLPQSERNRNLSDFRARKSRILVSTDVGSRGLDIANVGVVINYDVPRNPDDYVHRVGRTARAGKGGLAITLVGARDVELVKAIEGRVGTEMQEWKAEGDELVNVETRVVKDGGRVLKEVGTARLEALRDLDGAVGTRDQKGRIRRLRKVR